MTKEDQILGLRKEGRTYREIAEILHCGQGTVAKYIKNKSTEKDVVHVENNWEKELKKWDVNLLDFETQQINLKTDSVAKLDQLIDILPTIANTTRRHSQWNFEITIPEDSIIACFADPHIGSPDTEYTLIRKHLELISKTKNVFIITFGDLIDNFNVKVASLGNQSILPLDMQKRLAYRYLERFLPTQEKILGMLQGNHEERSIVTDDFDFTEWVARQLKVNYFGLQASVKINTVANGELIHTYPSIFAHSHRGYSSWNKLHGALRAQFDLDRNAEIVGLAHRHEVGYTKQDGTLFFQCKTYQHVYRWAESRGIKPNTYEDLGCFAFYLHDEKIYPYDDIEDAIEFHGVK